ncbi:MAG: two-component sensor histidine kinase, partial [Lacrimispora sphenoides]
MFQVKFFNQKHAISLRVTLIIALLVVGIIPVFIQNSVMLGTYRQNLIESRMQDIQNQCWILSNKMTRIG